MSSKSCCVYCHTNKINGKRYVGITSNDPYKRWQSGNGYKHNAYFTNAIKKYGWDNFEHEIIISNIEEEYAKSWEKMLINLYHSNDRDFGYNLSSGGEPMSGVKHTDATKHKMSVAAKNKVVTQETREKISKAIKNRNPEIRYKFAHSRLGKTSWNKGLTGENSHSFGKEFTVERKKHISDALKGKPKSLEHRMNLSRQVEYIPTGEIFWSMHEGSKYIGVQTSTICNHCNNRVKSPKWKYVEC